MKNIKSIILGTAALLASLTIFTAQADEPNVTTRYFSGTVEIDTTQMAFIISGQAGGGILEYGGKEHEFSIGGLGIGAVGIKKMNAVGVVWNMEQLSDFEGIYLQAAAGAALGESGTGTIQMANSKGVVMELKASNEGASFQIGAEGLSVKFK